MAYQYKRRRRSLIRNFWVYRRLIGSLMLLGIMLWFIWANNTAVTVAFPFRLGHLNSTLGVVILLSAVVGSVVTFLIMTVVMAVRKIRGGHGTAESSQVPDDLADDRPPPDYAAKTPEGFSDSRWAG
ncbi:MAG: lipopolysaccharide assembly protein LapA domain-containing protein [Isosphaeraceae bacterium]